MHLRRSVVRLLLGCACALAPAAHVQAQAPAPGVRPPASPAPADPEMEAARLAWESLPMADRRAAQEALVWTNDYTGVNDGVFGRRTRDALTAFESRSGQKPDGIISRKDLDLLLAAGKRARDAARFTQIAEDPSGAAAFLPMALFTRRTPGRAGSRYLSADGAFTFDTAMLSGPDADLNALYERLRAEGPGRKVSYKLSRPDWFVVSGESGPRRFYSRFNRGRDAQGADVLRGFTIAWPATRTDFERMVIAVANSFDPFPAAGGAGVPSAQTPATPPASAGQVATAISLGQGRWLSVLPQACARPQVNGQSARALRSDAQTGLTLLEGPQGAPGALALAEPREAEALVIGFTQESGAGMARPVLTLASGRTLPSGERLFVEGALQPGFAGAAVVDRQGRLVGLAGRDPLRPVLVAGIMPAMPRQVVAGALLSDVAGKAEAASAPAQELLAGEIAARWRERLAPVLCP